MSRCVWVAEFKNGTIDNRVERDQNRVVCAPSSLYIQFKVCDLMNDSFIFYSPLLKNTGLEKHWFGKTLVWKNTGLTIFFLTTWIAGNLSCSWSYLLCGWQTALSKKSTNVYASGLPTYNRVILIRFVPFILLLLKKKTTTQNKYNALKVAKGYCRLVTSYFQNNLVSTLV